MKALLRSLLSKPSYAIISIVVLGVSIAAQLDIAAIVDGTLLRAPSGRSPQEFAFVRSSEPGGIMSYPDYLDIKQRNHFFSSAFAYANFNRTGLSHDRDSATVSCEVVSGNFFSALGIEPAQGRLLDEQDDVQGATPVVMVAAQLAERWKLAAGSLVRINGAPFTVVGLVPDGFEGIERDIRPEVWMPCAPSPILDRHRTGLILDRNLQWLRVAGRLKPGVAAGSANAELGAIARQLQRENPVVNTGMDLKLDSFTRFQLMENDSARTLLLISGIVWLLFALAFANFFSLTLLRIFTRRRELAIKLAMGATRCDFGRWLLGELGLLVACSVVLGYLLSRALLWILRLDPILARMMESAQVAVGWRPLALVAPAVAAGAAVVWLLSLRAAGRVDLQSAIKESSAAPKRRAVMTGLYALQFALALSLLSLASSFVAALHAVAIRPLPFRSDNLLLLDVPLRGMGLTELRAPAFIETLLTATRQVPGVIAAGASSAPLLTTGGWTNLIVDGRDPALAPDKCFCRTLEVTPDFWQAAGIATAGGHTFSYAEVGANTPLGVINAAAARRFWPGKDAVGQTFRPFPSSPLVRVIGVVADVPQSRAARIDPLYYRPAEYIGDNRMTLHIAVRRDSSATRKAIRRQLAGFWPDGNFPPLRSIRDQIDLTSADLVTSVRLVLWVAGFATLITGCGLYFFSAYTASQSIKDSAIRLALGAERRDIILAHIRCYRLAILLGAGLAAGLLAAVGPILARLDVGIVSPRLELIGVAAVPLALIALAGLCVPLLGINRLNVYRTLVFSE
ncbi:MAG TPA: ABC transporter permease [Opitutaceae bacterium]|nr:ABC transporter permease [Opitutaceae bacterium]